MEDKNIPLATYIINVVAGALIGWFGYPDEPMAAMICGTWMLVSTYFIAHYKQ